MAYADQEMSGSRVVAIVVVAILHAFLAWALVTGLAVSAYKEVAKRVTTVDVIEEEEEPEEEEPPPPPPPQEIPPPPVVVPESPFELPTDTVIEDTTEEIQDDPPFYEEPAEETPPADPPPPPCYSAPAQRDNFRRWAARIQEAYPSRAIRREIEGNVGVSVVIGTNGRVQSCSVTGSSGEKVLDDAACKGMERYARYDTAVDCDRNPTTGRDSLTIVYRLN